MATWFISLIFYFRPFDVRGEKKCYEFTYSTSLSREICELVKSSIENSLHSVLILIFESTGYLEEQLLFDGECADPCCVMTESYINMNEGPIFCLSSIFAISVTSALLLTSSCLLRISGVKQGSIHYFFLSFEISFSTSSISYMSGEKFLIKLGEMNPLTTFYLTSCFLIEE